MERIFYSSGADNFMFLFAVLMSVLCVLGLLTIILLGAFFIFRGVARKKNEMNRSDAERSLMELNQMAQRLESRIESLETILMAAIHNQKQEPGPSNKKDNSQDKEYH